MDDIYASQNAGATMPAAGGFDITPHNDNELTQATRAIYVGTGGDLTVELLWGGTLTFRNLPDGALLPVRARKVLASSTVGSIIGLY